MGQLNGNGNTTEPNVMENKYLNLAGLTSFWTKVKQYIIDSQATQTTAITNAYTTEDNTIRDFIGKMTINGHSLAKYTAGADQNTAGTLTLGENLTINSSEVPLTEETGNTLGVDTVDEGLIQLDTRMDVVETALKGGVVTKVTVVDKPDADTDADLITFTSDKDDTGTGNIKLTLNHTKLNQRIQAIDALDTEFAKYSVNEKALFNNTSKKAVPVVLTGEDIKRDTSTNDMTIAQTFTTLEDKIAALASATEFKGVVTWNPATATVTAQPSDVNGVVQYKITGTGVTGDVIMQNGDIVINEHKEYILDGAQLKFVELGDTTQEQVQLSEIQAWINNPITEEDIANLFNEE